MQFCGVLITKFEIILWSSYYILKRILIAYFLLETMEFSQENDSGFAGWKKCSEKLNGVFRGVIK
jgi:hypothetical protein